MPDLRLDKISHIIRELRSQEIPDSAERIKILGGHGRVIDNGIDVTDSLLVGFGAAVKNMLIYRKTW